MTDDERLLGLRSTELVSDIFICCLIYIRFLSILYTHYTHTHIHTHNRNSNSRSPIEDVQINCLKRSFFFFFALFKNTKDHMTVSCALYCYGHMILLVHLPLFSLSLIFSLHLNTFYLEGPHPSSLAWG